MNKNKLKKAFELFVDAFNDEDVKKQGIPIESFKWIIDSNKPNWILYNNTISEYGFDGHSWFLVKQNDRFIMYENHSYTSYEKIESILSKVVMSKGFYKGVSVNNTNLGTNFIIENKVIERDELIVEYGMIKIGGVTVMHNGIWANIISPKFVLSSVNGNTLRFTEGSQRLNESDYTDICIMLNGKYPTV